MAFMASPRLPEADKLIMGHIFSFMALASMSEGSTYKQAVKLLSLKYDMATATRTWDTWAPYLSLPEGHHVEGGDLAKDFVIAILCKLYTTAKLAKEAAKALVDNLVGSRIPQAFIDHTIPDDLDDEEDANHEVTTSLPPPSFPRGHAVYLLARLLYWSLP